MTHVVQGQLQVQQSVMTSPTAVLVLEIYQWQTADTAAAQSDLRTSAVSKLNRARSRGVANSPKFDQARSQMPASLARPRVSSSSSSSSGSGSSSSSSGAGKAENLRQSAQLTSEPQSDAESNSGRGRFGGGNKADSGAVLVPLGVARFPLRHIPEDRSGVVAELDGEVVGVRGGGPGGMQEGWPCVVEVQAWDAAQYSAEQLKNTDKGQRPNQSVTNEPQISLALVTSPAYASHMMSIMTEDLLSKQTALEKLQRAVLRAEGSSQLGLWRVHEAEKRNGVLAADLAQLRKLLHEEKSSSKVRSGAASFFLFFAHVKLLPLLLMLSHVSPLLATTLVVVAFFSHVIRPLSIVISCMPSRAFCFLSVPLSHVGKRGMEGLQAGVQLQSWYDDSHHIILLLLPFLACASSNSMTKCLCQLSTALRGLMPKGNVGRYTFDILLQSAQVQSWFSCSFWVFARFAASPVVLLCTCA